MVEYQGMINSASFSSKSLLTIRAGDGRVEMHKVNAMRFNSRISELTLTGKKAFNGSQESSFTPVRSIRVSSGIWDAC